MKSSSRLTSARILAGLSAFGVAFGWLAGCGESSTPPDTPGTTAGQTTQAQQPPQQGTGGEQTPTAGGKNGKPSPSPSPSAGGEDGGKPARDDFPSNTTPDVILVNQDYDRLTSRVLVRRVLRPTLANLDFAAHDSNVMTYDPKAEKPKPPETAPRLSDLHFDNALVPKTLADRLADTPLTPAEQANPMAWLPLREYLLTWDFDAGGVLANAADNINDETWNDDEIPVEYQVISRVYLHREKDGQYTLWARIEFKHWVKFLKGVDDEDKDGFAEIYGQIDPQYFNEKLAHQILQGYLNEVLSPAKIKDWAFALGMFWYPAYNTETLKNVKSWPDEKTEAQVKKSLNGKVFHHPDIVIRGKPLGKFIYNVFLIGAGASD